MTITLQVAQAFDIYHVGDQIALPDAVAQALQKAFPGRFQFVSSDGSSSSPGSGSNPGSGSGGGTATPPTGSGLTLAQVDAEIATALTTAGVPSGATVPGLISSAIAAQGTGSGVSAAQAAALALVLG